VRWIAPVLTVAAVAVTGVAVGPTDTQSAPQVRLTADANPLVGLPFYVNPPVEGHARARG